MRSNCRIICQLVYSLAVLFPQNLIHLAFFKKFSYFINLWFEIFSRKPFFHERFNFFDWFFLMEWRSVRRSKFSKRFCILLRQLYFDEVISRCISYMACCLSFAITPRCFPNLDLTQNHGFNAAKVQKEVQFGGSNYVNLCCFFFILLYISSLLINFCAVFHQSAASVLHMALLLDWRISFTLICKKCSFLRRNSSVFQNRAFVLLHFICINLFYYFSPLFHVPLAIILN